MNIVDIIVSYWDSILIILATAAILVMLYMRGQKNIVRRVLYGLVTEAEERFGGGTGALKQSYVLRKLYGLLPAVVKVFISAERIAAWIEEALSAAKEKWAESAEG